MNDHTFNKLSLRSELLSSIESLDYVTMTPIQSLSLPIMLTGQDLIAQAQTGSGKTAAFAIGLLNKLDVQTYQTQALVLCPTRELADQVSHEIRRIARDIPNIKVLTLCGGKPMGAQLASLQRDPHIVVGTPGRILKHLSKETLDLAGLKTLVLDEADRMLDMGFIDDLTLIIDGLPKQRQTLLFSATIPDEIKAVSKSVQVNPIDIRAEATHENELIKQVFYQIDEKHRSEALVALLQHYSPVSTLVFCNTKQQCEDLHRELRQQDIHALTLHGDLEQFERDQVLVQFSNGSTSVLIATDVAARGLDIKELSAVVSYELTRDPEVHIHRIGRTGRAGSEGLAIGLFTTAETARLRAIEEFQGSKVQVEKISSLTIPENFKLYPPMVTLRINAGRKDKIRPGDILGALTATAEIPGNAIGKITIFDKIAYVAVQQKVGKQALSVLDEGKIKGRNFRVTRLK